MIRPVELARTTGWDAYLPVEVDTDVGPHVFGTDGQDLRDRETPGDTVQSWTQQVAEDV